MATTIQADNPFVFSKGAGADWVRKANKNDNYLYSYTVNLPNI